MISDRQRQYPVGSVVRELEMGPWILPPPRIAVVVQGKDQPVIIGGDGDEYDPVPEFFEQLDPLASEVFKANLK